MQPATTLEQTEAPEADDRTFRWSLVVSGIRCTLQYLVLPWLLPLFGFASGVGVAVTIVIGIVAIGFNAFSIVRMRRSDHAWRTAVIAVNVIVIALLSVLLVQDLLSLA